jgi:hypothetical protein
MQQLLQTPFGLGGQEDLRHKPRIEERGMESEEKHHYSMSIGMIYMK